MCLAVVRPNLKDKVNHLSEQCCRGETGSYRFFADIQMHCLCTVDSSWHFYCCKETGREAKNLQPRAIFKTFDPTIIAFHWHTGRSRRIAELEMGYL